MFIFKPNKIFISLRNNSQWPIEFFTNLWKKGLSICFLFQPGQVLHIIYSSLNTHHFIWKKIKVSNETQEKMLPEKVSRTDLKRKFYHKVHVYYFFQTVNKSKLLFLYLYCWYLIFFDVTEKLQYSRFIYYDKEKNLFELIWLKIRKCHRRIWTV